VLKNWIVTIFILALRL